MSSKTTLGCLLGLLACVTPSPSGARPLEDSARGYVLEVLVDGVRQPVFHHRGEAYVLGRLGKRYTLRVRNTTGRRVEAVVSVDGRDILDGQPADFRSKRGYVIPAHGQVEIDGWRLSLHEVAAFRFSSVAESYAAQMGGGREVGVIGVAIFPERAPVAFPPEIVRSGEDLGRPEVEAEPPRGARGAPSVGESAPSAMPSARAEGAPQRKSSRPGLGTEFGERVDSRVRTVEFERRNPSEPEVVLGLRYNDRAGLIAMGVRVDRRCPSEAELRRTADPFPGTDRRFAQPPLSWCR